MSSLKLVLHMSALCGEVTHGGEEVVTCDDTASVVIKPAKHVVELCVVKTITESI